jgi:hypothetical protein
MDQASPAQKRPKIATILLIAAFFVVLWLPLADLILHLDSTPTPSENRALAPIPVLTVNSAGLRQFTSGWDAYYRDHFGFRNLLVRWESRLNRHLFHGSAHTSVGVGQQGWLFFFGDYVLDNYLGVKRFSEADLAR